MIRLSGHGHGIMTNTVHKTLSGGRGGEGVRGEGSRSGGARGWRGGRGSGVVESGGEGDLGLTMGLGM